MSITLHGFPLSGHSHRVQLALSLLGLESWMLSREAGHA